MEEADIADVTDDVDGTTILCAADEAADGAAIEFSDCVACDTGASFASVSSMTTGAASCFASVVIEDADETDEDMGAVERSRRPSPCLRRFSGRS